MEILIASSLNSKSQTVRTLIERVISWTDRSLITQEEKDILSFMCETFDASHSFPSGDLLIAKFSSWRNRIEFAETVSEETLPQHIIMLEKTRIKQNSAKRMMVLAQKIQDSGITSNDIEELKTIAAQTADDIKEQKLSPREEYLKRKANATGLKLGIKEIDDLMGGLPRGTVMTIAGYTGSFKCVDENTLIHTDRGLLTIKEIVHSGMDSHIKVLAEDGLKELSALHYEGHKPSVKLTIGGREITTSPVHRFRCLELKSADAILDQSGEIISPAHLQPKLTWVMAKDLHLGDLIVSKTGNIASMNLSPNKESEFFLRAKEFEFVIEDEPLREEIDALDGGLRDSEKEVLEAVLECWSEQSVTDFIAGIFANAGVISIDGHVGILSNRNTLAQKVANILIYFGLPIEITDTGIWLIKNPELQILNCCEICNSSSKIRNGFSRRIAERFANTSNAKNKDFDIFFSAFQHSEITESTLYDLSVCETPSYVANGFVTHNTTSAVNMAYRNAHDAGYNIAYISLEVAKSDINYNLWSLHSRRDYFSQKIEHRKIRQGTLTQEEEDYLFDTVIPDYENTMQGSLTILDETDFKTFGEGEITEKLEEVDDACGGKLDAIVVDHANLCKFYGDGRTDNTNEATNKYISYFRRLGIRFRQDKETGEWRQIAVILLAQTNRQGWMRAAQREGEYDLTALAEANELERCSSAVVAFFANANLVQTNQVKVGLLKSRFGQVHPEPFTTDLDPATYFLGDPPDKSVYDYKRNDVTMDDIYNANPSEMGLIEGEMSFLNDL